jgi:hypothetical protein
MAVGATAITGAASAEATVTSTALEGEVYPGTPLSETTAQ